MLLAPSQYLGLLILKAVLCNKYFSVDSPAKLEAAARRRLSSSSPSQVLNGCELISAMVHKDSVIGLEERYRQGAKEGQGVQRPDLATVVSGAQGQARECGRGQSLECHSEELSP